MEVAHRAELHLAHGAQQLADRRRPALVADLEDLNGGSFLQPGDAHERDLPTGERPRPIDRPQRELLRRLLRKLDHLTPPLTRIVERFEHLVDGERPVDRPRDLCHLARGFEPQRILRQRPAQEVTHGPQDGRGVTEVLGAPRADAVDGEEPTLGHDHEQRSLRRRMAELHGRATEVDA